jgi:hypothetical protein
MYREFASTLDGMERHVLDPAGLTAEATADAVDRAIAESRLRVTSLSGDEFGVANSSG